MALATYIKAPPKSAKKINFPPPKIPTVNIQRTKNLDRGFFALITIVGIVSMVFSAGPIVWWQVKTLPKLLAKIDNSPVPQGQVLSQSVINSEVEVTKDENGFSYFTTNYVPHGERPEEYTLTIPKLEIQRAKVLVDTIKFEKNLSHFPGTAIPGEIGNSFVTGHSSLPQLAKNDDYRSIFTEISDLEVGDEVYVEKEGKVLRFAVQYSKIVDPSDLSVLSPISQTGRNLTLMTCVPPGTNTKRLVVVTTLI